jgi:hypothetical protein
VKRLQINNILPNIIITSDYFELSDLLHFIEKQVTSTEIIKNSQNNLSTVTHILINKLSIIISHILGISFLLRTVFRALRAVDYYSGHVLSPIPQLYSFVNIFHYIIIYIIYIYIYIYIYIFYNSN